MQNPKVPFGFLVCPSGKPSLIDLEVKESKHLQIKFCASYLQSLW